MIVPAKGCGPRELIVEPEHAPTSLVVVAAVFRIREHAGDRREAKRAEKWILLVFLFELFQELC